MIQFPDTSHEENIGRFLRILHASLPSDVSCVFSRDESGKDFEVSSIHGEHEYFSPDLKVLAKSPMLPFVAGKKIAICPGHCRLKSRDENGNDEWIPSSVMLLPWNSSEERTSIFCFCRFGEDAYGNEDLYFGRSLLNRYQSLLLRDPRPLLLRGTSDSPRVDLEANPFYLSNLVSSFLLASCRVLPIDAIILTLWSDVVPKGNFLQLAGYSSRILSGSEWFRKNRYLSRFLGDSFRVHDFHFYFRKFRFRMEIEEVLPRMPVAVSERLTLGDRVVGTVTLKTGKGEDREEMKKSLPDLVPLLLWEMKNARRVTGIRKHTRGSSASIIKTEAFQDDLIHHYRSARRFGDPLSAIVFTPSHPSAFSGTSEESFSRLYLLMRKSVRAIDSACFLGLNGFLILLPRAGYRDALNVAERLMKLACEVMKHDRLLGKKTSLEYRVVSFPESAKNEGELWESLHETIPV
jgi:hypothetical protein